MYVNVGETIPKGSKSGDETFCKNRTVTSKAQAK